MLYREATVSDIEQIQQVRHSVRENILSNPLLVTDDDCRDYITCRGKGWVCEVDGLVVGFAIADIEANNIWALFLRPAYEKKGIGKTLHQTMLHWYFSQTKENAWLSTEPCSRAEGFYRKMGWKEVGPHGKSEIKFEMDYQSWIELNTTKGNI